MAGPAFAAGHSVTIRPDFTSSLGPCTIGGTFSTVYNEPYMSYIDWTIHGSTANFAVNVEGLNNLGDGVSFLVDYGPGGSTGTQPTTDVSPTTVTKTGTTVEYFTFSAPATYEGSNISGLDVSEQNVDGKGDSCSANLIFSSPNPPIGQMPEVPWAAGLPVLGLAAAGFVLYRRRNQSA